MPIKRLPVNILSYHKVRPMIEPPKIVITILESVSSKLGRQAIFRKVNNREEYFILDLSFSYFQNANRKKRNDYRSGYLYVQKGGNKRLLFALAHTPVMLSFFKKNFDYRVFRAIIERTAKYRVENYLRFSRYGIKELIRTPNLEAFLRTLDEFEMSGFARMAFRKSKTGKTGVGNLFGLCLADRCDESNVSEVIEESWDLFQWLYPTRPIFTRNASLNRNLKHIEMGCEFARIKNLPEIVLKTPCCGQVEGAHIVPHKYGGSDKLQNGLWLCNVHHRLTEGKLDGSREIGRFNVKYKE